jgi:hypothetical protein
MLERGLERAASVSDRTSHSLTVAALWNPLHQADKCSSYATVTAPPPVRVLLVTSDSATWFDALIVPPSV